MAAFRILTSPSDIPAGDYVSEGLSIVMPDACFPNMVIGDKANHPWPYLRREVSHNWYCDQRAPEVGFLNRDEAILLHNLALPFQGKPALEVGSWMGWSTCHLALAGLALDVIDPVLADSEHATSVRASLAAAGVTENVRLYATASPDGVRNLAQLTGIKWHFFFIDGDHESPAPAQDALECMAHAARDAMIVFHDLTSPDVEEGLQVLWRHGWQVLVYQTMQIMGVAWRGEVQPVAHTPDPSIAWSLPLHLAKYPVSGSSPDGETRRLSQGIAWRDQEIEQLQEKLTSTSAELDQARSALAERDMQLGNLQAVLAARDDELVHLRTQMEEQETELARLEAREKAQEAELAHLRTEVDELKGLRTTLTTRDAELAAQAIELARLEAREKAQEAELAHLRTEVDELKGLRTTLTTRDAELAAQAIELARLEAREKAQEAALAHLRTEVDKLNCLRHAAADELKDLRHLLTTRTAELERVHVEVNSRDGQLRRLTFEVTRRSQEVECLSSEIERLQLGLDAVHSSVSWKITRPLRTLKRGSGILRRMSHRFVSEIGKEEKSLPPDIPRVLRLMRATWAVAPRSARYVLRSLRLLSPAQRRYRETVTLIANSRLFDPVFYCAMNPDVAQAGLNPLLHYVRHGVSEGRDPHPLFDTSFYCEMNPDVVQAGLNPLLHYVRHGVSEGRDPHPLFDTSFYCEMNPDVVQAGLNPLLHYVSHGVSEGRDPHPLFDTSFYCEMNPAVAQAGLNPLCHYVRHGASEGRDPHPLFDTSFYCEMNPDVVQAGLNPLLHYVSHGVSEGRDPHPLFDTSFYCEMNPDVVQAGLNPLLHYVSHGVSEGRDPHPLFDTSFYCEMNPAVAQAGLNPLCHYVRHGASEGRDPHPLFDTSFYCEMNPDVVQAGLNPLLHYVSHGVSEGRDPHPLFDTSFYCEMNPDVVQAGVNPLLHYVSHGVSEGRDPHPLFDTSFYLEQKPHVRNLGVNPLVHFLAEGPTADFDPLSSTPLLPATGICIVTPDIVGPVKNGGIGTACYHFARVLAEAGHPVSVFFTGDVTDCQKAHWRNTYAKMRIKFIALSDTPPITRLVYGSSWFCERSWRVFEYLRQAQFSVVHFQDWQANGFWSIKAKRVGLAFGQTTLTVMTHSCTKWINEGMQQFSATPFETAKLVWAETYCMEHCDLLLSPSRHMLEWIEKNQIHIPPRTLLTPYAWTDGNATAPRAGDVVDSDHLIFFGRLETRKGLHIFGEALRCLQREGAALPRAISFLGKHASVQGQPSTDYLEALHRDLPTVDMHIINDFDYIHALDYIRQTRGLVVLPSIFDNYPLTVLECIQSGVPFIAANTGGIPEMIDARVSFDPDPASLAACLKTRNAISHGGLKHKYSASLAAKIWRDLHAELQAPQASRGIGAPEQGTQQVARVSVCIPFFNHQQYLESLVTAFAHQSYPAFEVILVNDGSSPEASREFERVATRSHDRRFHFLTTENFGPGAARNFAAEQATGDVLLFFDADNLPKGHDFIGLLVRAMQHSQADCVTCPYDIVNADRIFVTEPDVMATYRPIGACIEAGFFENTLGDATLIISRAAFRKLGGFPTRRAAWEDHEFLLNLCFKGLKLETFPETIFYYRYSLNGRNQQVNEFRNYQSLFSQLQEASTDDLVRIIAAVSGPMLLGQAGGRPARLITQ